MIRNQPNFDKKEAVAERKMAKRKETLQAVVAEENPAGAKIYYVPLIIALFFASDRAE